MFIMGVCGVVARRWAESASPIRPDAGPTGGAWSVV